MTDAPGVGEHPDDAGGQEQHKREPAVVHGAPDLDTKQQTLS